MNKDAENQFNTYAELAVYSAAQHETISKLNAKINLLEEKEKHLQKLLSDNSIIVGDVKDIKDLFLRCEDPEAICRTQLKILRDRSLQGELSIEEAKRTEIYTKILDTVELKRKDQMKSITSITSTEELLKLVANETNANPRT